MTGLIGWFARNHVAANIMMVIIIVAGVLSLPLIRQEVFPGLALPLVSISVDYPGASPEEVEEAICSRIEEALNGMQGVSRINSTAGEGRGTVAVELDADEDVTQRMEDVRSRVDRITTFPMESEAPVIQQAELRFPVLDVAVAGHVDERTLKRLGERTRDEIAALPGVSQVDLIAARRDEISIEVSERALQRHGLTFDDVVVAVQRSSLDLPGGTVKTRGGEIRVRTLGQAYDGLDFEQIVVVSRSDGTRLTLGDVGRVVDGFEESDQISRFDGRPAVIIQIFRVGDQSALEISSSVRAFIADAQRGLPVGVSMTIAQDDARFLRDRLDSLLNNAWSGFLLVFFVLALFLRLRLAAWVTLGIPTAFLGTLALLPMMDVSINLISLMGFIVVLGIVVDDAIVIGENTCTEQARTRNPLEAAISGAGDVAMPVTFGVLTTVAAFAPLLFIDGPMGRVVRVIPLVVIACLLISLFEALFILPAHLAHGGGHADDVPIRAISRSWRRFQDRIATGLDRFVQIRYRAVLEWALEWRYLTAALALTTLIVTAGMLGGGWLRFVFQPEVEGDVMVAYLSMPAGTPSDLTATAIVQIENAAESLRREIDGEMSDDTGASVFSHVLTSVGTQPYLLKQASGPAAFERAFQKAGHIGEVQIEVVSSQQRDITAAEMTRRWRALTGEIPGAEELTFSSSIMSAGAPMSIDLSGFDLDTLRAAAAAIREELTLHAGVMDISDSFRGGKQELELEILPEAEALGLTLADLGRQVRQAFYGHEAQRVQRGREDVPVMVRYPETDRRSLGDLEQMRIRTAEGIAVPFSAVARARMVEGLSTIRRVDRKRTVTVTANVDPAVGDANGINAALEGDFLARLATMFPDVEISLSGEQREQTHFLDSLKRGWVVALLAIYALLAIPLRSYGQPLIIMSAIPFGLVGAVWGHVLLGHDFSMFSVIGVVALSGVVVNDSLVLVDYTNQRRAAGDSLDVAIRDAGTSRFRAIMLTTLTTFAGLSPMMVATSVQSQMLVPMAISLAFGVVVATAITLLLVPVIYLILDDIGRLLRGPRDLAIADAGRQRNETWPAGRDSRTTIA